MNIEQVLECSAAELKAMSDEDLHKHFSEMLPKTRPEFAAVKKVSRPSYEEQTASPEELAIVRAKIAKLRTLGIEVDEKAYIKKHFSKK